MTDEGRQLVTANRGIALAVLRRMHARSYEDDADVVAQAMLALCEAVNDWNPDVGHSLQTHLWNGVRWRICKWLTKKRAADFVTLAADGADNGGLENYEAEDGDRPDALVNRKASALAIRAALRSEGLDGVARDWMSGASRAESCKTRKLSQPALVRRRTRIGRILREHAE